MWMNIWPVDCVQYLDNLLAGSYPEKMLYNPICQAMSSSHTYNTKNI